MDLEFLVENIPIMLLMAGFASLAPLFRGRLKPISSILVAAGFLIGILELYLAYAVFTRGNFDVVTLTLLVIAGLMLFLRPVKNMRWAALVAFLAGVFVSYYVHINFILSRTALIVVFVATTLLLYLLFKFAEDLLGTIGSILSFAPIAIVIGMACVVQATLLLIGLSLATYVPPINV